MGCPFGLVGNLVICWCYQEHVFTYLHVVMSCGIFATFERILGGIMHSSTHVVMSMCLRFAVTIAVMHSGNPLLGKTVKRRPIFC